MSDHGWVVPRPDGFKARCGGPGICAECQKEKANLKYISCGHSMNYIDPTGKVSCALCDLVAARTRILELETGGST